jgi:hypothetical protein
MKKLMIFCFSIVLLATIPAAAQIADIEDLVLEAESFWNGSDGSGGFTSDSVHFNNLFDDAFGPYWEGFAFSNVADNTTPGIGNQYSAITGEGADGSSNYVVGYVGFLGTVPTITIPEDGDLSGFYITNTTYAYLIMKDGDINNIAKQFGGPTGTDPDWFLLTITGKDADGATIGEVEFYLADFRSDDSAQDYIVNEWTWVDLTIVSEARTLEFALTSSDVGNFGMNTPAYFALDEFEWLLFVGSGGGCFLDSISIGSKFKLRK